MWSIKKSIKKKIKIVIKELYEEYIKDGKITITPDIKNQGVQIKWTSK